MPVCFWVCFGLVFVLLLFLGLCSRGYSLLTLYFDFVGVLFRIGGLLVLVILCFWIALVVLFWSCGFTDTSILVC